MAMTTMGAQIVYPRLTPFGLGRGELGRIDGVTFIESNVNLEDNGKIDKRTGYADIALIQKFKEIDERIKREWGK